jgi:hypothetical protein
MAYALIVTIITGLSLLALLAGLYVFSRRGQAGGVSFGAWRWHPSSLGLTIALIVAGVVLWRFFPGFLFIPLIFPFFWRFGRGRLNRHEWRGRSNGRSGNGRPNANEPIEGRFRPLDDE